MQKMVLAAEECNRRCAKQHANVKYWHKKYNLALIVNGHLPKEPTQPVITTEQHKLLHIMEEQRRAKDNHMEK